MSNFVLVIDSEKQPLNPIHPGQARRLLKAGIPAVFRRFPFVIILKQSRSVSSILKPLELKIDPGSKTTGMALLQGEKVVFAAELEHRGQAIRAKLETRRNQRMSRRSRHTRYPSPRFRAPHSFQRLVSQELAAPSRNNDYLGEQIYPIRAHRLNCY
ncbi:HNH endonuclease [Microseira wollei NIES-4236]|uniref:HNH endonuclease n=1 Tax=Microseira wollei NIES-4236 TaxID=2530354 RepID=A0AAV3XLQ6_9CYAN|nr:HNH endonuclease [Microseira wollei NIES-4236]